MARGVDGYLRTENSVTESVSYAPLIGIGMTVSITGCCFHIDHSENVHTPSFIDYELYYINMCCALAGISGAKIARRMKDQIPRQEDPTTIKNYIQTSKLLCGMIYVSGFAPIQSTSRSTELPPSIDCGNKSRGLGGRVT